MSAELVPMIQKNELGMSPDIIEKTTKALRERRAAPLSTDRESGLFLLFCSGDTIESLAFKTQMPVEIILATAIHYQWPSKARALRLTGPDDIAVESRKQLLRQLVIATHVSIQKQLTDIIAGREDPSTCALIPTSIGGLEKLLAMVEKLGATPETPTAGKPTGTTIINNPQNVQVVQQQTNSLPAAEPAAEVPEARAIKLRKLREQGSNS